MPADVVVTRVTPVETPGIIPAVEPLPLQPIDADSAEVLRFLGVTVPSKPAPTLPTEPPTSPFAVPSSVPAAPAPPAPAAPATPASESPPAPAAPAAPPAAPAAPDPLATAADKLAQAADRLGRAAEPAAPAPATPTAPVDPELELRREALKSLQTTPRFAGRNLVGEYDEFLKDLGSYRARWEKAHPDETFDYEDAEHEKWKEANEPDIDDEAIIRAEARVEARREVETRLAHEREQTNAERARERAVEVARTAPSKLISDFGVESFDSLKAKDADLALAVRDALPGLVAMTQVVHEICRPGVNPESANPHHQWVLGTVRYFEDALSKMPAEQATVDGRRFVSAAEYDRMPAAQQASAWSLKYSPDLVEGLVRGKFRELAESRAAEMKSFRIPAAAPAAPATAPVPAAPAAAAAPAPAPAPKPPAPVTTPAPSPLSEAGGTGVNYFA